MGFRHLLQWETLVDDRPESSFSSSATVSRSIGRRSEIGLSPVARRRPLALDLEVNNV